MLDPLEIILPKILSPEELYNLWSELHHTDELLEELHEINFFGE